MYGKMGEFLVEPISRSQFVLTVKMESGAVSTFSIDSRTKGRAMATPTHLSN